MEQFGSQGQTCVPLRRQFPEPRELPSGVVLLGELWFPSLPIVALQLLNSPRLFMLYPASGIIAKSSSQE